jgi:hypothetical protein
MVTIFAMGSFASGETSVMEEARLMDSEAFSAPRALLPDIEDCGGEVGREVVQERFLTGFGSLLLSIWRSV